eukprot:scaffold2093_cov241-Pinguiococcus_pyrenoidosus.AAC.1
MDGIPFRHLLRAGTPSRAPPNSADSDGADARATPLGRAVAPASGHVAGASATQPRGLKRRQSQESSVEQLWKIAKTCSAGSKGSGALLNAAREGNVPR